MKDLIKKLCSVERDRAVAAEICIDELLTMMDRHNVDGAMYNMLINLSAELHLASLEVEGGQETRARRIRVRSELTKAFSMTDEDLEAGVAPVRPSANREEAP